MSLFSSPPHRVSTYSVASTRDSGGGTTLTYTIAQAAVPCIINTASASTVEMYAQDQIKVTITVAMLASAVSPNVTRGMKLVADDTGASFHVEGIRQGRQMGSIPPFVYADCSELL